ncbi:S-methyl-5'-thioadenosine phosphorylase [Candidatus Aminicenantes bacterium AH-873-B07]|jgi:5'-methylthioadenosine phosphorylase|nr:S-methyl-5'-thioadenosine phosphorylase [Candidatus Aminicenantes bacterium AH-873-B07]
MKPNYHSLTDVCEVGILGGTGLYEIEGLEKIEEIELDTPFGKPSDCYVIGKLNNKKVAFLARHGKGHKLMPSEINYRANIYGFKMLGVQRIISVSAVGSLKEEIKPQDIVFPDQFFDRTRRINTFFGNGIVAHISFDEPVCPELIEILFNVGKELSYRVHKSGIYICIEGPAFSTRGESLIYRKLGGDVIGMTSATEAKLAREAEICYVTMNVVSDYDAWHLTEEPVSVEIILENLKKSIDKAKNIIKKSLLLIPSSRGEKCECHRAIENTIVTAPNLIPSESKERIKLIIEKYLK